MRQIGAGPRARWSASPTTTAREQARKLAERIWHLRVMDDDAGRDEPLAWPTRPARSWSSASSRSTATPAGAGDPSWIAAARPEQAEPLVQEVVDELRRLGAAVATGRFRAEMAVELVNDGPVTVLLDV